MSEWKGYEPGTPEAYAAAAAYEAPSWADATSDRVDTSISDVETSSSSAWDTVVDWVDDAWETVTEPLLDIAYTLGDWVWSTGGDVGLWVWEAFDTANDWVDEKIETVTVTNDDTKRYTLEMVNAGVEGVAAPIAKEEETIVTFVDDVVDKVVTTVTGVTETVTTFVDDKLTEINVAIDFGFDWLASRLEDLLEIPARAFFRFIEAILPEVE